VTKISLLDKIYSLFSVFGGRSLLTLIVIKNMYQAVIARAISQLILIVAKDN